MYKKNKNNGKKPLIFNTTIQKNFSTNKIRSEFLHRNGVLGTRAK